MTPIAHTDHLLTVAHQRNHELAQAAQRHRWWQLWRRRSTTVPVVRSEPEVALAA
ncbi:MAG: hypothetical protein AAGA99_27085 [Actinomycetota bacterium]